MTYTTALPLSPAHGAASARLAELRTEAERHQLARAARRRRAPAWPVTVAAALRDSLAAARPSGRAAGSGQTCPTC